MNVLIIHDNKYITDAISLFVESQGHSCLASNDGKEGCNIAKKENFDLILLDIAMPELSGYDILNTFKKDSNFDILSCITTIILLHCSFISNSTKYHTW